MLYWLSHRNHYLIELVYMTEFYLACLVLCLMMQIFWFIYIILERGMDSNLLVSLFKSDSHLPKILLYLLQWKTFKNMKNAFYFILKALFICKIFKFLSWLFGHDFFVKNHAQNVAGWLVPDLFLFVKKALYQVKASGLQLSSNIFW